jgi:hypothetical protein
MNSRKALVSAGTGQDEEHGVVTAPSVASRPFGCSLVPGIRVE